MLMPERSEIACPHCRHSIRVPLQAELRSRTTGTAISCPACHTSMLMHTEPGLSFQSLSTPRKMGPVPGRRISPDLVVPR